MAILGMEQFGWVLGELIPGARRGAGLDVPDGRTKVLLPAGQPLDELPESWQVTSDSIAATVATRAQAGRLVLVKDVDGLFAEWPARGAPLAQRTVAELAARPAGGVDAHLPAVLERAAFETWVVGGRHPERLAELLERGATVGTRIVPPGLLR
jgi:acetylglutamate kinase